MRNKMKLQQILIVFLAIAIAILLVTLLVGRNNTVTVVVVGSKKVDTTKKLNEQKQYFEVKKILKSDMKIFGDGNALVTSISELEDQYLRFSLPVGSPIPKDFLSNKQQSGEYASEMTKNHTTFKIVDGKLALPAEIQAGDIIDVMLTLEPKDKEEGLVTGPLLTGVEVKSIVENDVYVSVTQNQFNQLALGQEIGKFVLQLPGQKKDSKQCDDLTKKEEKDGVACYSADDEPKAVTEDQVRQLISDNAALSTSKNTDNEASATTDNNQEVLASTNEDPTE